jgi:hypothetical protein
MIKINHKLAKELLETKQLGVFTDFGSVMDEEEFIIVHKNLEVFLAHKSEFDRGGLFTRIKE